jgi:hypothetical protein
MATSKSRQLGKEEMLVGTGMLCLEATLSRRAGGCRERAPMTDRTSCRGAAPLGGRSS